MNKTVLYKSICRISCFILVCLTTMGVMSAKTQGEERISLSFKDAPLEQVMDAIKQQSQYLFVNQGVDEKQLVSIKVTDQPIKEACRAIFNPIKVDFIIDGTAIIIKNRPEPQSQTVRGTVKDSEGQVVPGVSVFIQGTQVGTTTDLDGRFELVVPGAYTNGIIEKSDVKTNCQTSFTNLNHCAN